MRLRRRSRLGLVAIIHFRDEAAYLPGFLESVAPEVDGLVALDHGSSDGSRAIVEREPKLLELVDPPRVVEGLDEPLLKRTLTTAALAHRPRWLLGIDADERLEVGFRERADAVTAGAAPDTDAFYVRWLELWDRPDRYRADGLWGQKEKAALFRARDDHLFDERPLHTLWAPLNRHGPLEPGRMSLDLPHTDLLIYHLRMLGEADRRARRERYEAIDPERRWQPIGYEYLTDTSGLRLEPLPAGRGYHRARIA